MLNVLILLAGLATAGLLFWPPLARSRLWRATITPLASIIGSGFLVLGPVLEHAYGYYAPVVMAALCAGAYAFGNTIRYNITMRMEAPHGRSAAEERLEAVASWALSFAYVISVAYYLNLFGAFAVSLTPFDSAVSGRIVTTAIFAVILVTLLVQGLSLPWLIETLGIDGIDDGTEREENIARKRAAKAALDRLEELSTEDWVRDDTAERVGGAYRYRYRRFSARFDDDDGESIQIEERSESYQRLARELLEAQRTTVIAMRDSGEINDDVLRIIERELDLEDSRLEI